MATAKHSYNTTRIIFVHDILYLYFILKKTSMVCELDYGIVVFTPKAGFIVQKPSFSFVLCAWMG